MKKIGAGLAALILLFAISGCVSNYATESNPAQFEAPYGLDAEHLAKTVTYSLASRHWDLLSYDLNSAEAIYRGIKIRVTFAPGDKISIARMGKNRREARHVQKWMISFQRTINKVALYCDEDDFNEKLKARHISPQRIEDLAKQAGM